MARNPYAATPPPPVSESVRVHLRIMVDGYLAANAARAVIPDAELIALHPLLGNPLVYQLIKADLAL